MEFGIEWFINYFIALGIISMAFVIPAALFVVVDIFKMIKRRKETLCRKDMQAKKQKKPNRKRSS